MRNIVVVDAVSTGYNYIEDIIRRGYNPVVLETNESDCEQMQGFKVVYKYLHHKPEFIHECEDYNDTVQLVRKYDPVLILAGCESGVVLATKLSASLSLPGNPVENIDMMTKKDAMQEALKKAGIRYILGKKCHSVKEALEFCEENKLKCAVVKPIHSAGSQGLFLCDDLTKIEEAVNSLLSMRDIYDNVIDEVLVQERIFGTEYIVNTISCNGKHRLSTVCRYKKEKTPEGGYIYDYTEFIDELEPGHSELIEYAYSVADAIGYRYGEVHGEYMVDEKGPVLIEVNCRPMGGGMPGEYVDMITGQHETDSILDSYLDPVKFEIESKKPYRLLRKGYFKMIIVPKDIEVDDLPLCEVAKQLRSTYSINAGDPSTVKYYSKTRDLETSAGIIFLVNEDRQVLHSDLEILRHAEKKFFELLLNDGTSRRWIPKSSDNEITPEQIIKDYGCHGSILVVAEEKCEIEGAQVVTPSSLSDAYKGFEYVICAFGKTLVKMNESECLRLMFEIMDKVKQGGKVIIPQGTYDYLSYGKKGAEELMKIKGLMIEAPVPQKEKWVVGTSVRI